MAQTKYRLSLVSLFFLECRSQQEFYDVKIDSEIMKLRFTREHFVHDAFDIGISLKGLDGVLEVIGGIILIFATPARINKLAHYLTQSELSRDPHDFLANYLTHAAHNFTGSTQIFSSIFLLTHGAIKIFLVAALWKNKHWAYPTAIAVFGAFTVYQIYRYFLGPSLFLIVLTILDIFVIALTWLEYNRVKDGLQS